MSLLTSLIVVLLLVLASGFFEGAETGFTSARRVRLLHRARGGNRLAALAARLSSDKERVIQAAVVGGNVMIVSCSAVATVALTARLGNAGETVATITVTTLSIILGQILPKTVFRAHPETLVTWAALPFWALTRLLWPLQMLVQVAAYGVLRLLRQPAGAGAARLTKERILKTFELSYRNRALQSLEDALVRRFAEASTLLVQQVMTPLASAATVSSTAKVVEALALVRQTGHSRLPVRDEEGRVSGLLLFRDLIDANPKEGLEEYARTMVLIAAEMGIDEGIAALSYARASMAAVVDATDTPIGIVTLEDLLEPLVGDIADEHDAAAAA